MGNKIVLFSSEPAFIFGEVRCAVTQSGCTFSEYVVLIKAPFLFKECVECALYTSVDNEILGLDGQINWTFPRKTNGRGTRDATIRILITHYYTRRCRVWGIRENAAYYDSHRM